jgi:hypothetical protein
LMGVIESLIAAGWVVKFWPMNRAYSPFYSKRSFSCVWQADGVRHDTRS